jgi:hypothetical protein
MCQESVSSSKPAITNMAKMLAAHSVQFHHGGSRGGVGPGETEKSPTRSCVMTSCSR